MAVTLDHTIVHARDAEAMAQFLTHILGLPPHRTLGHFTVVLIDGGDDIASRPRAFLVSEAEFDAIFVRLEAEGVRYWADSVHREPGRINRWDDGCGVYFDDPNGHGLEILTRPYGSGGLDAVHPNPLLRH